MVDFYCKLVGKHTIVPMDSCYQIMMDVARTFPIQCCMCLIQYIFSACWILMFCHLHLFVCQMFDFKKHCFSDLDSVTFSGTSASLCWGPWGKGENLWNNRVNSVFFLGGRGFLFEGRRVLLQKKLTRNPKNLHPLILTKHLKMDWLEDFPFCNGPLLRDVTFAGVGGIWC